MAGKNREKARVARGRSSWCFGCDAAKVWDGQRCKNCGYIAHNRNRAKPKAEFCDAEKDVI